MEGPAHWNPTPRMGYLTACGCTFSKLDILHDGTIVPCNMPNIPLGNIQTDLIREIWHTHPVLEAMRAAQHPDERGARLHTCEWNAYCTRKLPGTAVYAVP